MCDHEHILDFFLGGLPINFVVRLDVIGHPAIKKITDQTIPFYNVEHCVDALTSPNSASNIKLVNSLLGFLMISGGLEVNQFA